MSVTGSTSEAARKSRQGKGCIGVFFAVFLLVGLGATFALLSPIVDMIAARNWRETTCTILKSGVAAYHPSKGGPTYSVDVSYEYMVDDQRHVSSRYKFVTGSTSGYEAKKEIVDRLRPGTQTRCFVDRRNPSQAVIERGFTADLLAGCFPMIFAVIGAGGLYGIFIHKPKARAPDAAPGLPVPVKVRPGGKAAALKSRSSPAGRLGCAFCLALFWNGFVSVFVGSAISSWARGSREVCGTVMLIPFVLVGFFLIGWTVYSFLAFFNPRPVLRVSGGAAALGDTVEIEWESSGNVDRVKAFAITLEGREEATYPRGKGTATDKFTFKTIPIVSSTRGKDMRRGKAKVDLPADTMHTFRSSNNRILWSFQVKGDIPRWPDIGEEFLLEVLPLRPPPVPPSAALAKEGGTP
jgi:hypothetical protein